MLPFGNDAEDVQQCAQEILDKKMTFTPKYNDSAGKKCIEGFLQKDPEARLGNKAKGWAEVMDHKFFKQGVSGNLFSKITGRELPAPLVPEVETYQDVDASMSDREELGVEEPKDFGVKLMNIFRRFDLNGDG